MGISASIALLPGDGVGPEIVDATRRVIDAVGGAFAHTFELSELLIGGAAIDAYGTPLRDEDLGACRRSDAVLLGAIGGPKWDDPTAKTRPELGLLRLRQEMGLFANLRPVTVIPALADTSPVKASIVSGVDLMVVRELTGGLYFGRPRRRWKERRGRAALDTLIYREFEVERVARVAFELARGRRSKVASVDKANVIETSRLWRTVVTEVHRDYEDVELEHVLVDAMAMRLVRAPGRFDVVVTENMFGDILTDEASVLAGSIGLLPSASIGAPRVSGERRWRGLFEPIHGSAPHMTGTGRANPTGTILSFAMLLRLALSLEKEAATVERAVTQAIEAGVRTPDIVDESTKAVTTDEFGAQVAARIHV